MNFISSLWKNNTNIINKVNFEDIQTIVRTNNDKILINTLDINKQNCLIKNTISAANEETLIRNLIDNQKINNYIIIYGENCNSKKIYEKYSQLINLGFYNVYLYTGGLFEWLCLQDIYGKDEFPTTSLELDILKFKPQSSLNKLLLTMD
tara:strand:+ start:76 stop:525 length:450 start_codon:yes stop_codon:yes gene_type:complete